jgi:hypothetical protein
MSSQPESDTSFLNKLEKESGKRQVILTWLIVRLCGLLERLRES